MRPPHPGLPLFHSAAHRCACIIGLPPRLGALTPSPGSQAAGGELAIPQAQADARQVNAGRASVQASRQQ